MTEATKLVDRLITLALQQGRRDRDADDGEPESYKQLLAASTATLAAKYELLACVAAVENELREWRDSIQTEGTI